MPGQLADIAVFSRNLLTADPDDIGGFAPLIDIARQRHDMLYSRLFRS